MAIPAREIEKFRRQVTQVLDETNTIPAALALVEGAGADDAARVAFFTPFFTNTPDYDITSGQFFEGIVKLRQLETWLKDPANRIALSLLRI
jgi:hypothetical protein